MAQCDKQNNFVLQWLTATHITEKIFNFFVACDKGIGKNAKNKHPFKFKLHHRYPISLGYLEDGLRLDVFQNLKGET